MSVVPEIDQQHQELIRLLNRLNDAVKNRELRQKVYQIMDEIIVFTRRHFESEERLMFKAGYPEIEAHKEKHRQLVEEALHLKEKLDYVGDEMFTDWFNHWPFARVLAHIQYADEQIKDYIVHNAAKQ